MERRSGNARRANRLAALAMSAVLMLGAASPSAMASGEDGKWYTDFGSYEEEQQYASELNIELMAESMVLLKNQVSQMVYKHAISTIVPSRAISINQPQAEEAADEQK